MQRESRSVFRVGVPRKNVKFPNCPEPFRILPVPSPRCPTLLALSGSPCSKSFSFYSLHLFFLLPILFSPPPPRRFPRHFPSHYSDLPWMPPPRWPSLTNRVKGTRHRLKLIVLFHFFTLHLFLIVSFLRNGMPLRTGVETPKRQRLCLPC